MKKTNINIFAFLLLTLLAISSVHAANNTFVAINSSSTGLHADQNYIITWSVTDSNNLLINTTAMFFKNGANIVNVTYVNNFSISNGSNVYSATLGEGNFSYNDIIFTNVTSTEAGNFTARNSSSTANITILTSTTALIQGDAFDFLSGLGVNLGSFMTAIVRPIGSLIIIFGLITALGVVFFAIFKLIEKHANGSISGGSRGYGRKK